MTSSEFALYCAQQIQSGEHYLYGDLTQLLCEQPPPRWVYAELCEVIGTKAFRAWLHAMERTKEDVIGALMLTYANLKAKGQ